MWINRLFGESASKTIQKSVTKTSDSDQSKTDQKGVEYILQFSAKNDRVGGPMIVDIGSFHSGKLSRMFIEAIEPSDVLQIEKQDLYFLYTNMPKLNMIFKVIVENKYIELQNRVLQSISSTAQERYLTFLEHYPKLALRLLNRQIASYLGITSNF